MISIEMQPGTTFDQKFTIIEKLGSGGQGTVYKAHHLEFDREVALKVLHMPVTADNQMWRRLIQEARICSALAHENIVKVYSVGMLPDKRPYLVMEYVEGSPLSTAGKLPWFQLVGISIQVLAGLNYAHRAGVIHRDLKPSNILLAGAPGGAITAKILDFGLAKVVYDSTRLTITGFTNGTAHYMSPEQTMGAKLDGRSDIYSWGCSMYEVLTGTRPFGYNAEAMIMHKQQTEFLPPVRDIPSPLQVILDRALAKSANDRWETAESFAKALAELDESLPVAMVPEAAQIRSPGSGTGSGAKNPFSKLSQNLIGASFIALIGCALVLPMFALVLLALPPQNLVSLLPNLCPGKERIDRIKTAASLCKQSNLHIAAGALYADAANHIPSVQERISLSAHQATAAAYQTGLDLDRFALATSSADEYNVVKKDPSLYADVWNNMMSELQVNTTFNKSLVNEPEALRRLLDLSMYLHKKALGTAKMDSGLGKFRLGGLLINSGRYADGEEILTEAARESLSNTEEIRGQLLYSYFTHAAAESNPEEQLALLDRAQAELRRGLRSEIGAGYRLNVADGLVAAMRIRALPASRRIEYGRTALDQLKPFYGVESSEHCQVSMGNCLCTLSSLEPDPRQRPQLLHQAVSHFQKAMILNKLSGESRRTKAATAMELYRLIGVCLSDEGDLEWKPVLQRMKKLQANEQFRMRIPEFLQVTAAESGHFDEAAARQVHAQLGSLNLEIALNDFVDIEERQAAVVKAIDYFNQSLPPESLRDRASLDFRASIDSQLLSAYEAQRRMPINWLPERQKDEYGKVVGEVLSLYDINRKIISMDSVGKNPGPRFRILAIKYWRMAGLASAGCNAEFVPSQVMRQSLEYFDQAYLHGEPVWKWMQPYLVGVHFSDEDRDQYSRAAVRYFSVAVNREKNYPLSDLLCSRAEAQVALANLESTPPAEKRQLCNLALADLQRILAAGPDPEQAAHVHRVRVSAFLILGDLEKDPQRLQFIDQAIAEQRSICRAQYIIADTASEDEAVATGLWNSTGAYADRTRRLYTLDRVMRRGAQPHGDRVEEGLRKCRLAIFYLNMGNYIFTPPAEKLRYLNETKRLLSEGLAVSDSRNRNRSMYHAFLATASCSLGKCAPTSEQCRSDLEEAIKNASLSLSEDRRDSTSDRGGYYVPDQYHWNTILALRQRSNCQFLLACLPDSKNKKDGFKAAIADNQRLFELWKSVPPSRKLGSRILQDQIYNSAECFVALGNLESTPQLRKFWYAQAIDALEQVVNSGLDDGTWCATLGECYLAIGDVSKGKRYVQIARAKASCLIPASYADLLYRHGLRLAKLSSELSTAFAKESKQVSAQWHKTTTESYVDNCVRIATTPMR